MCSEDLTCIEPETAGNIIAGMPFHRHYFSLPKDPGATPATPANTTMANVTVRKLDLREPQSKPQGLTQLD